MNKKTIAIVLAITTVLIIGLVIWGSKQTPSENTTSQNSDQQADIIYYYGQECPHCKNVEKFIADNKIDEKISFAKKEVWHNEANSQEMQNKAKECALDPEKIGVPFLFARGKCYIGEIEVQDFLKKEAGIQ